jgi:hypothetical protein
LAESTEEELWLALKAKTEKDIDLTGRALEKIKILAPERSHLRKIADDYLTMARAYYEDAKHFYDKGDYLNAFGCVNYAHGWLDAGARQGIFDVGGDDQLFTLAE